MFLFGQEKKVTYEVKILYGNSFESSKLSLKSGLSMKFAAIKNFLMKLYDFHRKIFQFIHF